jgi:hypothetical protein
LADSQPTLPVADGLSTGIAPCKDLLTTEETLDADTYVFEPANGYAEVRGVYPTCGCECEATAAAYRCTDGSYRYLSREAWSCDYRRGLTGSDWGRVLPNDLRAQLLPGLPSGEATGVVVLDAVLPRKGTTTTLQVRLIPIGLDQPCPGRVCDRTAPQQAKVTYMGGGGELVNRMIQAEVSQADLKALARGGPSAVSKAGQARTASLDSKGIGEAELAEAQAYLVKALKQWSWVKQVTMSEVVLQWDRDKAVFTVDKEKSTPAPWGTFLDYLRAVGTMVAAC